MNKEIIELNISEENKILISKIEKRISSLSSKAQEYFEKSVSISGEKIQDAYSNNENLISILEQNSEIAQVIREEASTIREEHQTNFTTEQSLDISKEVNDLYIINNTLDYKDNLVTSEDKKLLLKKKINYLKNKNNKRKEEYAKELDRIDSKLEDEEILDIEPMLEDIKLIKKFIDRKKIKKGRTMYIVNGVILTISLILLGVSIWILTNKI